MTKKRKIILIGLAVTLALAVGVGGFVYANNGDHEDVGGNKLLGVGEMGYYYNSYWGQDQCWDTQFIITNPNCERDLTIEWVALIAGEDTCCGWMAEDVIAEGTPYDWNSFVGGPMIPDYLTPHEVWQVSIAELCADIYGGDPDEGWIDDCNLGKYTLEVTWSGAHYRGWWWWGYWRSGRPLTGWQKEKCWSEFDWELDFPGFAISEAPMELFPSRTRFQEGEPYFGPQ